MRLFGSHFSMNDTSLLVAVQGAAAVAVLVNPITIRIEEGVTNVLDKGSFERESRSLLLRPSSILPTTRPTRRRRATSYSRLLRLLLLLV